MTVPTYITIKSIGDYSKKNNKNLKIKLHYDPAIPILFIYLKKNMVQSIHAPQCSL